MPTPVSSHPAAPADDATAASRVDAAIAGAAGPRLSAGTLRLIVATFVRAGLPDLARLTLDAADPAALRTPELAGVAARLAEMPSAAEPASATRARFDANLAALREQTTIDDPAPDALHAELPRLVVLRGRDHPLVLIDERSLAWPFRPWSRFAADLSGRETECGRMWRNR